MANASDDLWSEILGRAAHGERHAIPHALSESKVHQSHMSPLVNQDVLGLEVAVGNALLMEVIQSHYQLTRVKRSILPRQTTSVPQQRKQLTARDVLHKEIQIKRILEGTLQPNHVRTPQRTQQLPLISHMLNLMLMQHSLLLHHFEREKAA